MAGRKLFSSDSPSTKIRDMTEEVERIIAALEKGEATPGQQKEAARVIRDLDRELRELLEWQQGD
jgi:hypothetical protein